MSMEELKANVSKTAYDNIQIWLTEPKYDEYHQELEALIADKDWHELDNSFFKVLEFGTAGRRGTTGVGSNRINRVTIGESAQALCAYAAGVDEHASERGIVIACDTRLSSPELSRYAASVCAANGFKTYFFEDFRSTPELSFTVRHLNCAVGIVVSASHNPPPDNGFKAYWEDGAQLVAPHDKGVMDAVGQIKTIATVPFDEAVEDGRIIIISSEVDEAYLSTAAEEALGVARDLDIVYSPLHGAGQTNTLPLLKRVGFSVQTVESQMVPDGHFPTVENGKANPEARAANDLAVAQMMSSMADVAITNDPDADRLGVMVRYGEEVMYLTGNQSGALATDYSLKKLQQANVLMADHYIVKTIVTTDLMNALAEHYGVKCYDNLLIGFKYIGELIRSKEGTDEKFVLAAEESFGSLKGSYARDKDGATGALPIVEYAAELKLEGKTLRDKLFELFEQHGLFTERIDTVRCEGASGFQQMQDIMARLHEQPLQKVGSHDVTAAYDYQRLERADLISGAKTQLEASTGNVVTLEFGDKRRRITVRPSGTEPILKLYVQWYDEPQANIVEQYDEAQRYIEGLARELEGLLLTS